MSRGDVAGGASLRPRPYGRVPDWGDEMPANDRSSLARLLVTSLVMGTLTFPASSSPCGREADVIRSHARAGLPSPLMGRTPTVFLAAVALVLTAPGSAAAQKRISWEGVVRMTDAYTHAYDSGGSTSCEGSADTVLTVQYELPQHSASADGTPPHGLAAVYDLSNRTGRATGTGNCSGDAGPCGTFTSRDDLTEIVTLPDQPNAAQGSIRYYPDEGKVEFVFGGGENGFTFEGADFTTSYSNADCGTQIGQRPSWPAVHVGGPRLEKDPTWEQGDDDFRLPVAVRGVELFVRGTFLFHRDGGSAGQSFNGLPIGNSATSAQWTSSGPPSPSLTPRQSRSTCAGCSPPSRPSSRPSGRATARASSAAPRRASTAVMSATCCSSAASG